MIISTINLRDWRIGPVSRVMVIHLRRVVDLLQRRYYDSLMLT